jgi:ADP-ribose pyrophosphatase
VPLDEALAWIRSGRITEVKTIAGLLWAERILSGGWPV